LNEKDIKNLLKKVKDGKVEIKNAIDTLKQLPFENLDYARIDHHRTIRRGHPETIFCEGKTLDQIRGIVKRMIRSNTNILATRAKREVYEAIQEITEDAKYYEQARIVVIKRGPVLRALGNILVITAGTADIPIAEEAAITAEVMGNAVERLYDVGIAGIHRILAYRQKMEKANVLIVAAGMDGALPAVVAGLIDKPVIALPTSNGYGTGYGGFAALLTMLNSCAAGVSVVNIDNGYGAGYSASLINQLCERKD